MVTACSSSSWSSDPVQWGSSAVHNGQLSVFSQSNPAVACHNRASRAAR